MEGHALNGSLSVPLARVPGSGVLSGDHAGVSSSLPFISFHILSSRSLAISREFLFGVVGD